MLATVHMTLVYVPRHDNTVAFCLICWANPAGKAWTGITMHGDAEGRAEAKRIMEAELLTEEGEATCFVLMRFRVDLA